MLILLLDKQQHDLNYHSHAWNTTLSSLHRNRLCYLILDLIEPQMVTLAWNVTTFYLSRGTCLSSAPWESFGWWC